MWKYLSCRSSRSSLRRWLAVGALSAAALPAPAQQPHELLFFLSAEYVRRNELETSAIDNEDLTPSVDFFYSRSANRFRLLAEALITDDENELERLQFGWQLSEATRLWVGRFHEPGSWWNTEYHHGQFLQTSISRPAIEQFEDLGGVLPSHTTGLLFERQQEVGNVALDLAFSAGLTGTIEEEGIAPHDLLDPESGHGDGASLRLAWLPELLSENQIGLTWRDYELNVESSATIPAAWLPLDRVDLESFGVFADWSWGEWRLNVVGYDIHSTPRGGSSQPPTDFVASYAQVERRLRESWVFYGRVEHTSGEEDYLDLFPAHVHRQSVFGAKWTFAKQHALSVEATNAEISGDHFHGLAIQWSAVVP